MSNLTIETTIEQRLQKQASQVCDCFYEAALAQCSEDLVAILAYVTSYSRARIERLVYEHRLPSPRQLTWMAGCLDRELVMKAVPYGVSRASKKGSSDPQPRSRFLARPGEHSAALALAALLRQALRDYSLESVAFFSGLSLASVQALTKECKSFQLAEQLLSTVGLRLSIKCRDPYIELASEIASAQAIGAGQSHTDEKGCEACAIIDDWRLFVAQSHVLARKIARARLAVSGGGKRFGVRYCNG